jgi:hypothetical protein
MEGIRRLHVLGAARAWVGSGQPFYQAIGFERRYREILWDRSS